VPPIDGFIARRFARPRGSLPYRLFIPPGYDKGKRYPLIVWLHGAGGAGTDNIQQIVGDQVRGTHTWTVPAVQAQHPAFVLVPQSNVGWYFADGARDAGFPPDLVIGIIQSLRAEFSIDSTRVYVSGQSIGGGGAWVMLTSYPRVFAAGIILCPVPSEPDREIKAAAIPIRLFLGAKDDSVTVANARAAVARLTAKGGHVQFTEYPDLGHEIWDRAFQEPDLVSWLFAQHK
jgi:predicted peptidase